MRIQFDLPDPAAALLLRLMGHIRLHQEVTADKSDSVPRTANEICQSMIVDLLVDDAVEHGLLPKDCFNLQ